MANPALVGTTSHANTVGPQSSLTNSHTVPSGANLLIIPVVTFSKIQISTVVWNSTGLTLFQRLYPAPDASYGFYSVDIFLLFNPTPATGNIVATPASSDYLSVVGFNVQDAGSAMLSPYEKNVAASSASSFTVPSLGNALMLDIMVSDAANQVFTQGGSQTLIYAEDSVAGTNLRTAASQRAGASPSQTMAWTLSVGDSMSQVVLAIPSVDGTGGGGGGTSRSRVQRGM